MENKTRNGFVRSSFGANVWCFLFIIRYDPRSFSLRSFTTYASSYLQFCDQPFNRRLRNREFFTICFIRQAGILTNNVNQLQLEVSLRSN